MFPNSSYPSFNGITYLTPVNDEFEKKYIALREKEGYLFSVDEVRQLPQATHNKKNWKLRADSAKRFMSYLSHKKETLVVLELGCGNGWFSNLLAGCSNVTKVYGCDVNLFELQIAQKAFTNEKLSWVYADIFKADIPPASFDMIILNSSVQYFKDLSALITHLKKLLKPKGEIHILDSPFYKTIEAQKNARTRSELYYSKLGAAEMAAYYSPHLFSELEQFNTSRLYSPTYFKLTLGKLFNKKINPFYWFKIENE